MAQSKLFSDSLVSAGDLTESQYLFAKLGSVNRQFEIAGEGDRPYGVLQEEEVNEGEVAEVMVMGLSFLVLGGEVTGGQLLKPDANGKGVLADTDTDVAGAIARESGNADEIISVLIIPGGDSIRIV